MERRNWTEVYWLCRKRISNLAPIQFGFLFLFVVVSLKTSRGSAQSKRMHSLIHQPQPQPHIPPIPFHLTIRIRIQLGQKSTMARKLCIA